MLDDVYDPANYPAPTLLEKETTARKLRDALMRLSDAPPQKGQYDHPASNFIDYLVEAGELEPVAVHAVEWLIQEGLLATLRIDAERKRAWYVTTPALWDWWRSAQPPETGGKRKEPDTRESGKVKQKRTKSGETPEWFVKVLLLLKEDPQLTDSQLATSVGKHRSTLSRYLKEHPEMKEALSKYRNLETRDKPRQAPRGKHHKSGPDGSFAVDQFD